MDRTKKREQMLSLLAAWHSSGKSITAYCRDSGIKHATFAYWKKRYNKNESQAHTSFVELTSGSTFNKASQGLTVIYPNGVQLNVGTGINKELLQQIVHCW